MDRIIEWLFKYPPVVFERGEIHFAALSTTEGRMAVAAALVGCGVLALWRLRQPFPLRVRGLLFGLRLSALGLLLLCLLRPVIVVPSVIPWRTTLLLLLDDSQSMGIRDMGGRSRWEVARALVAPESPFRRALEEKFRVRVLTVSGRPSPSVADAPRTDLASALERALTSAPGDSVWAVVLISDGAHNAKRDLQEILPKFAARRIPLYTIGVGQERPARDHELVRVNVPRRILKGSSVRADLLIRCGEEGQMEVRVSEGARVLRAQQISCDEEMQTASLEFTPSESGIHRYTFELVPRPQETIVENNRLEAFVDVRDEIARVLYLEGEPRWEYGKLRAAVADDEQLQLVSVVRTAAGKFYRQGVESGEELRKGFPESPEELFRFRGVILGSIEAGFFTREQLAWMEEFVGRRGGGLVMLGGRRAFSAGGYALTPLGDVLPVDLTRSESRRAAEPILVVAPRVTEIGRDHPITRLRPDPAENERAWRALPPVTVFERFARAKPGALVLLEGRTAERAADRLVLLAVQRYGRGVSLAFAPVDSWRWQMERDVSDLSHETFWKQMLRYLVSFAEDPLVLTPEADAYDLGDEVRLRVEARDEVFRPLSGASVEVEVETPRGTILRPRADPSREVEGEYEAAFVADEPGTYRIRARAQHADRLIGEASASVEVGKLAREFRGAGRRTDVLKWLARETEGRYFASEEAAALVPDVTHRAGEHAILMTHELWDMPVLFVLLIALLGTEWAVRRRYGMV